MKEATVSKKRKEKILEERKRTCNNLVWKLDDLDYYLRNQRGFLGRSDAYNNLRLALRIMQAQIQDDHRRYRKVSARKSQEEEIRDLQQSLNRERVLRQELESKIKEATTSSGLFIKFVKEKLGV